MVTLSLTQGHDIVAKAFPEGLSPQKHEMEQQEFKMSLTGVYGKDAMLRQIAESVRINRVPKRSLNTKNEWNYVKLPRAIIEEKDLR